MSAVNALIRNGKSQLSELAEQINSEHEKAKAHAKTIKANAPGAHIGRPREGLALSDARAIGALLLQARPQLGYGEWLPWLQGLQASCNIPVRMAQVYMRLAKYWPDLLKKDVPEIVADGSARLGEQEIRTLIGAKRQRAARIRKHPAMIARHGEDNAPWDVCWRDPHGNQREKSCGIGEAGLQAAKDLKRRIEEGRCPAFRHKPKRDRSNRNRIPTPDGLTLISDDKGKRVYRDVNGREWINPPPTGVPRTTLHEWEEGTPHNDGKPLTTSDVGILKNGRRAGHEVIYLKKEIDDCKKSQTDFAQGICNGTDLNGKSITCITRGALKRNSDVAISTIEKMENDLLLKPIPNTNYQRTTYVKNKALDTVNGWKKIWRKPGGKRGGGFDGAWDDGRLSIGAAALTCTMREDEISWLIKKGIIPTKPRKPPPPYCGRDIDSVLPADVRQGKKLLNEVRSQTKRISNELNLPANRRSELFKALLAGKSFEEFVTEWSTEHSARQPDNGDGQKGQPPAPEPPICPPGPPETAEQIRAVANQPRARLPGGQEIEEKKGATKINLAKVIKSDHPELGVRAVAKRVPCSHSLLSQSESYMKFHKLCNKEIRKGSKSKDGNVEATDDEKDEEEQEKE